LFVKELENCVTLDRVHAPKRQLKDSERCFREEDVVADARVFATNTGVADDVPDEVVCDVVLKI
jgi:hypothetical protein